MNDIINLMKNMLKCIPNNRMNVNNLLNHLLIILLVKLLLILLTDIVKFTLISVIIIMELKDLEIKDFLIELILKI